MYSAVLMLALTAGSETADFGRRGCTGCTGAVGTCSGAVVVRHGCTGSCGGAVASGCHGCHGGGLFARLRERHSCHGCVGSCGGVVVGSCGGVVVGTGCCGGTVAAPPVQMKPMPKPETVAPPKKTTQTVAPATILVSIPAGARLIVDGAPTSSTSEQRTLVTPGLEVGTTYAYTMRAEVVRDGITLIQTQVVNVRGGQTATVQFNNFSTQGVASR